MGRQGRRPARRPWSPRRRAFVLARARRVAAALSVGVAAWLVLGAALPHPPEAGIPVIVAARDLPAGLRLGPGDTQVRRWPAELVPTGALRADVTGSGAGSGGSGGSTAAGPIDADGRVLAGSLGAGEMLTESRLLGPGMLDGLPPGSVAVPVPLTDSTVLTFARPGDHLRVLVPGTGVAVAEGPVLLAEAPSDSGLGSSRPGRLILAVAPAEAAAMAAATGPDGVGGGFLAVVTGGR